MSGVFRSADGGNTWEVASDGLSDLRVHSIDVSPGFGTDGTLFAGTSGGLFRSTDEGRSWTRLHEGLRGVPKRVMKEPIDGPSDGS